MWTQGECAIGVLRLPQATAHHLVDMQNMHVVVPGEVLSARVSLGLPDLTKRKKLALWIRFDPSCIMLYSRNLKKWCRSRVHDYVRSERDPRANLLLHPHHPSDPMASSEIPVGNSIPAFTEHAISVSLPKLADNVAYEEGEARILDAMVSGYPRFFIQRNIRKVSGRIFYYHRAPLTQHRRTHIAFRATGTKIRHSLRKLPSLPLPQICRSMPRIPLRTGRPRARRTILHLRPPLHLPRAIPTGQIQHRQAILATHRSGHLQSTRRAMSRSARISLLSAPIDHSQQTLRKPALCVV